MDVRLSKRFNLQVPDFVRAAVMAAITGGLTALQEALDNNSGINWKIIGMASIGAGVAYLLKNGLLEPPKTIVTTDTNTKAVNANEKIKDAL